MDATKTAPATLSYHCPATGDHVREDVTFTPNHNQHGNWHRGAVATLNTSYRAVLNTQTGSIFFPTGVFPGSSVACRVT